MATDKKSLTINELADEIRKLLRGQDKDAAHGLTSKELMAKLRETFSFSKDKWAAARKLISTKKPDTASKPAKVPAQHVVSTIECICEDCKEQAEDELFDHIDAVCDDAEDYVGEFFAFLKAKSIKEPSTILIPDVCPAASPEIFRLLDLAVESGLLEKHIGFSISKEALRANKTPHQKTSKKAGKKKQ